MIFIHVMVIITSLLNLVCAIFTFLLHVNDLLLGKNNNGVCTH